MPASEGVHARARRVHSFDAGPLFCTHIASGPKWVAASPAVIDRAGTSSWRPIASAICRYATPSSAIAWNARPGPLETLFRAFQSVQPLLESNRPFSVPRHEIISGTLALQEREQGKLAALADALAIALRARGATDLQSVLAARTGMAAFALATVAWIEHPEPGLAERLDLVLEELKMMFTGVAP